MLTILSKNTQGIEQFVMAHGLPTFDRPIYTIGVARQRLVNFPVLISHAFPLSDDSEAFAHADQPARDVLGVVATL